jgi:hypothetical protein
VRELPVSLNRVTHVLVVGEWIEVRRGTATLRRDESGDLNGWFSFEADDDYTDTLHWCRIDAVAAFRASGATS